MEAMITFQFGIVLLLSRILIGHGFPTESSFAEMTPNDPVVEVGDTLVLNCTLKPNYNGTKNASDIYFAHSGIRYNFPYVRTLSNITAQLRLPNITSDMSGLFLCNLFPHFYLGISASQSVHIVRRPLQPVVDGCVITNWEQMECSWSPSREDQDQHTQGRMSFVQTLFYRNTNDGNNWRTCPQNISEKCVWPESQFRMGGTYCIQVNATNILKYVIASNVMCIQTQEENVKPNPPEDLSWLEDVGNVTLRWNPPKSKYKFAEPLVYQLAVRNEWEDQVSNFTVAGEKSLRIPVVPYTDYTVQISVRPARPGFFSDNSVLRFKTRATVPCKNPDTLENAFYLVKDSRQILLYWKPIERKDFCGPDLAYEVRARQSVGARNSADSWNVLRTFMHDSKPDMMQLGEEDELVILSKNSIGVATQLPHVIIRVPASSSETDVSSNYKLVVVGNNHSIMVHWFATAPVPDVTGYTLFWCRQQSFAPICKTPIQWKNLGNAELRYNLTLPEDYLNFHVGLAVNFLSGLTTGIIWADRLYSVTAKAKAPEIMNVVVPNSGSYGELDIYWTPAPCIGRCAYIETFVIYYCLADPQDRCQGSYESIRIASWEGYNYNLVNLEHGSKYMIWMTSIATTGESNPSDPVYEATAKSWVTAGAVAGIVVAVLCGGTIAIGGVYIILRCLDKYRKKFVNGLNIALPPTHRVQLPSTSSEVPMLVGKKFEYSRQESVRSVSSGDSGRYSLTPASPATSPLLSKLTDANENLNSFVPADFGMLEDTKVENDEDSTHECVLSYTIPQVVPSGAPNSVITLPNGAPKMGDPTKPGVLLNGDTAGHTKYIMPEQIERVKMFEVNPRFAENDVNYYPDFAFPPTSTSGNVADIGYTKIENLQPLYNLVNQFPSTDVVNELSDSDLLQFDTSQDEEQMDQSDLVPVIDELLATLKADHPLSDLQVTVDESATNNENNEPLPPPPLPPKPADDDVPFRGYAKIANTDLEWGTSEPGFSQQLPLSNWGYVDHAMFGVDSVV